MGKSRDLFSVLETVGLGDFAMSLLECGLVGALEQWQIIGPDSEGRYYVFARPGGCGGGIPTPPAELPPTGGPSKAS